MRRSHLLAVAAVVAVTAVVVVVAALGADPFGQVAPTPEPVADSPSSPEPALVDLAAGLPDGADPLAGEWEAGPGGTRIAAAPDGFASPLLAVPLAGRWADVTVEGTVVDGWSIAFDVVDAGTYQAVSVRTDPPRVELVRVIAGRAGDPVELPVTGDLVAEVVLSIRGATVQASVSGVALPTASLREGAATTTFGLLGRGPAAAVDAARWTALQIAPVPAMAAPEIPPLVQGRTVTADEVRTELSG